MSPPSLAEGAGGPFPMIVVFGRPGVHQHPRVTFSPEPRSSPFLDPSPSTRLERLAATT